MPRTAGVLALLLLTTAASAATQSDDAVVFTTQILKPDAGTASTFEARVLNVSGQTLHDVALRDNRHWGITIGRGAELVEVDDNRIHGKVQ